MNQSQVLEWRKSQQIKNLAFCRHVQVISPIKATQTEQFRDQPIILLLLIHYLYIYSLLLLVPIM